MSMTTSSRRPRCWTARTPSAWSASRVSWLSRQQVKAATTPLITSPAPSVAKPRLLPQEGPPALTTSHEVLCKLPHHQQQEEPVWLEGEKLCYKSSNDGVGAESPTALCICIDIGASKTADAPPRPSRNFIWQEHPRNWRRLMLFLVLVVLLCVIVLWPLQCIFTTGNMRCRRENANPMPTAATTTHNPPFPHSANE
ncbi:hypothetical protein fugu_006623 [Takifugu bimaculatus]|uniref:Uncharacterized protein n=1 Tax=Takifugu bimaculatus TaxID=433685 RepID=A0A4Z2B217_9TELE|nr:hypothetical protein fugu_006623 [Takifugu bimaculatus]